IAGACPPKYNRFSRRREFRSGFFADLRADVRVPVLVWEEEVQSQPIVRLSAHVSYSYFHFTLADHVFEIACKLMTFTKEEIKDLQTAEEEGPPKRARENTFRKEMLPLLRNPSP